MSSFDRVRPRTPTAAGEAPQVGDHDREGKRALFSAGAPPTSAFGSVGVECSSCRQTSVLSMSQAARAALPSVHLPVLRRRYPSWVRCPVCKRHTWARLTIRL